MWTALFGFIFGACIGSFLNVCIDRLPLGQSLVRPSSHCFACGKKLNALEMIPIASYLWLKGRCHKCGAAIPKRICAVELATGLLFAFILFRYGLSIDALVLGLYICLFLVLGVIDMEQGIILNKIVYPAMGVSLVISSFWLSLSSSGAHPGEYTHLSTFLNSVTGGAIFGVFFLLIPLLYRGGMGWGDVKMAVLVGLVTGFPSVLIAMFVALLSGGIVAGGLLVLRTKGWREAMPFAPFLSIGALVALLWGQVLVTWYLRYMDIVY